MKFRIVLLFFSLLGALHLGLSFYSLDYALNNPLRGIFGFKYYYDYHQSSLENRIGKATVILLKEIDASVEPPQSYVFEVLHSEEEYQDQFTIGDRVSGADDYTSSSELPMWELVFLLGDPPAEVYREAIYKGRDKLEDGLTLSEMKKKIRQIHSAP